jgi:iron complex transport system substrate-binding protein
VTKRQKKLLSLLTAVLGAILGIWLVLSNQPKDAASNKTPKRVIVTTVAQAQVMAKLDIPLIGVPTPGSSQILPSQYRQLPKIGNHVAPNLEKVASLKPDVVYLDTQLVADYQTKLKAEHVKTETLNFTTLAALQKAVMALGKTYHKAAAAKKLTQQLTLKSANPATRPKVLLLTGMPGGTFLVGTKASYVGDLITRAGGDLIGDSGNGKSAYVTMNSESIAAAQPTVIIRMAHAMPESVFASFDSLFKEPTWQSIPAVQNNQVFNATEPKFGMTANINAPAAFKQLKNWLGANQ